MITEKQIEIAKILVANGVDSVFHSVELIEDKSGVKFPAYKVGNEQYYVGPDDTKKMFAYIRQNGQVNRAAEERNGSCSRMYNLQAPLRIVIFQDNCEKDFDSLIAKFLKIGFISGVSLSSFTNNAFQLGQQESPIGNFSFDATTFYLAIDISFRFPFMLNNCEVDECVVYPNPINCLL